MRSLTAAELLEVWERARGETPGSRPAVLLAAMNEEGAAQWPIGRRDALLLELRERNFGNRLACLADCPRCGETVELEFRADDIRTSPPAAEPLTIEGDGLQITFRLPNSEDLAAITALDDPDAARRQLFARCLQGSEEINIAELSDETLTLVGTRMGEADRQADVHLALACPACSHGWSAPFDIAAFFWSELKARAEILLREVHQLAATYGWRESEILRLSPARRAAYLELVRA